MGQSVKRTIGRILLDGGFLSQQDLDYALEDQKYSKELLGQVLVRMGVLQAEDVKIPLIVQEQLGSIDDAVKLAAGERQLLGALLVQSGRITNAELDRAIAEQKRSGLQLGEVFKNLNMLTEQQLNALLDFQNNQEHADTSPLRLGELLVGTGHLVHSQLEVALHKQAISRKKLGEVLVEEGYVQPSQVEYGIRLQKKLVKAVLVAILSFGISAPGPTLDTAYAVQGDPCTLSIQLQSSPMRERYIANLATEVSTLLAHNANSNNLVQSDAAEDVFSPAQRFKEKKVSANQADTLDSFSKDCLSCHDGAQARDVDAHVRNTPGEISKGFDGTKQHPVGMDYAAYTSRDPNRYKPISAFNSKMIFVKGKVGCLTCHYPLNPEKNHLVMSDFRSTLCRTCHNKG